MSGPAGALRAIVATDILFRFRRTAALVTLLAAAAGVYLIVPDTGTGRTLMQIAGSRVLYNSAAVAVGTAMFCALLLSLAGYYMVSNSFRRDLISGTGFLIAASPVSNGTYVLGKFFGNLLYLCAAALACMVSAMVMFLIRGEGGLEPLVFLGTYAWTVIPALAFTSAAALAFESLPALSGRSGDVVYFFVWGACLGLPLSIFEGGGNWRLLSALDVVGIMPIIGQLQEQFHTSSMSIGSSTFDASRTPVLYPGLRWGWEMAALRASCLIVPAGLVTLARLWFHRFDPARIKPAARKSPRHLITRINALMKPAARIIGWIASVRIGPARRGANVTPLRAGQAVASFPGAVRADALVTLQMSPLTAAAIAVFGALSLILDASSLRSGLLPAMFGVLILALADVVPRDRASGMRNLLFTAPKIMEHYVSWKFTSALAVTLSFTLLPAVRLFALSHSAAASLLIGSCCIAGGAVGLGTLTGSRKPFVALFLMLLYIALNAPDAAAFDFAGFSGRATAGVQLGYALATVLILLSGHLRHRVLISRL